MYGERFKSIETFGIIEQIHRKYAQYHDNPITTVNTGNEVIDRYQQIKPTLTFSSHQQPNGVDRWGTSIKEMDSVEEEYFNGDEDEEDAAETLPIEEVITEIPFELKRRRSPDDDGDDELLQLAQKSPQIKGIPCFSVQAHVFSGRRTCWLSSLKLTAQI